MTHTFDIRAYLLAGGFSRRFGENKALYSYHDKPLIQHTVDSLSSIVSSVTIITNEPEGYGEFGLPVLTDEFTLQSPLVGLLTGLTASAEPWNHLFLAYDMPFITQDVIRQLLKEGRNGR